MTKYADISIPSIKVVVNLPVSERVSAVADAINFSGEQCVNFFLVVYVIIGLLDIVFRSGGPPCQIASALRQETVLFRYLRVRRVNADYTFPSPQTVR